jgi:hypothetical protein
MRALIKVGFSLLVLAFLLIGVSYAMLRTQGSSGPSNPEGRMLTSETRTVGAGISAVELSGPIDLTLRYGATPSLTVRGEQRLLGNIETSQDGATLHIGTRGMLLLHRQPLQAVLVLPAIDSLTVDGSGDSTANGFSGERINVQLQGSGSLKFSGRFRQVSAGLRGSGELELNGGTSDKVEVEVMGSGQMTVVGSSKQFKAETTGSGELDAQHLRADQVSIRQLGSGDSSVSARKAVTVSLNGSGDVEVFGHPSERSISRTGTGEVSFSE